MAAVGRLQHPGLLPILHADVAHAGDGLPIAYVITPHLDGETLRARLAREGELPLDDALRLLAEIAEAVAVLHAHDAVHGGIRPEAIRLVGRHALLAEAGLTAGAAADAADDQEALARMGGELLGGGMPPARASDALARAQAIDPARRFPDMTALAAALHAARRDVTTARRAARRAATPAPVARRRSRPSVSGESARVATPIEAQSSRPAPRRRRTMVLGALATVLIGGGALLAGDGAAPTDAARAAPDADPRRIAVLYFDDRTADRSLGYLADGLTEELIGRLAEVQGLDVVSRNGSAAVRSLRAPRDSIARLLGAGTLVLGAVEPAGAGRVRVTAQLLDARGTEIRRTALEAPAADPIAARDALATQVTAFLRERLGEEVRARAQRATTRSAEAWVLLQRAEQRRKQAEEAATAGDSAAAARHFAAADSIALLAVQSDRAWSAPVVLRSRVAYRQSRLAVDDPLAARPRIDDGIALAGAALALDSSDADALELRGNLRYWKWLLRLEQQAAAADRLLADARADLEASTRLQPLQAGAWGSLSHLYYQTSEMTDVLLAARRAYEADAWLENAATIVDRLFLAAYDLEQVADAEHWCQEGVRRFPSDGRFVLCRLYLMTMRGQPADVDRAWALAGSDAVRHDAASGAGDYRRREARMVTAAILARAGLRDSARAVVATARAGTDLDPSRDLQHLEAFVQMQLADRNAALRALKVFLAANPEVREDLAADPGWWFRDLADDPGFRLLVGDPG
jgi:serine/threonine-protein kinase